MEKSKQNNNYKTFFLMLACSFVAMYITMYLNTYAIDHVYFSLTRFYMACLGIAEMAVIMWFFSLANHAEIPILSINLNR